MKCTVEWDNADKTIIRVAYQPHWTWSDFYQANMQVAEMMKSVTQQVHVIADYTEAPSIPLGGAITHARNVVKAYPANWGLLLIVTPNTLVVRLVSIFRRTFTRDMGAKTFSAATLEDAYKIIERQSNPEL